MSMNSEERKELIKEFLVESHENLDRMDRDLVALERDATARDAIDSIFRAVHTIKGTCGFLGLGRIERLAHAGENVLGQLRDSELTITEDLASALLETCDALRAMLRTLEETNEEGSTDFEPLVARLGSLSEGSHADAPALPTARPPAPIPGPAPVAALAPSTQVSPSAPSTPGGGSSLPPDKLAVEARPEAARAASDAYVRVNVRLLDSLMNLVGELVLARNQMLEFIPGLAHQGFTASAQRLSLITTSIQSEAMKTRMQPIRSLWDKLPRVVRDLAVTCGKDIALVMEGQDTELDRTIIESIKDPLTHLVRNCVDHGIETPADREAAGKSRQGRLELRAFHEGGKVVIEIADDGAGLNLDRIRSKAIERGLISPEQGATMSERELGALIFLPGFSTAATISNVSGRGVGMDVVKTNIERIGGFVDLQTHRGHGTAFRIKIPLTLAIVPALIVTTAGERFAIPQINLPELVRLKNDEAARSIELIDGTPVYRLRGVLLPLVYLDDQLRVRASGDRRPKVTNIVVLEVDDRRFGLVVDGIIDTREIVVKPLGRHLKDVGVFAGATIMGDGRVALILDVLGLAQRVGLAGERKQETTRATEVAAQKSEALRSWLLCEGDGGRRLALPLEQVSRLEVFPRETFERVGSRWVVQYRGRILPVVGLSEAMANESSGPVHVVVHDDGERRMGVMVGKILDIVEDGSMVGEIGEQKGPLILSKAVTELVDLRTLMRRTDALSEGTWS